MKVKLWAVRQVETGKFLFYGGDYETVWDALQLDNVCNLVLEPTPADAAVRGKVEAVLVVLEMNEVNDAGND